MKTKLFNIAFFALLSVSQIFAQDVTTVRANSSDISDNLDLQAVASVFGEARDLEEFEQKLNDPKLQISNLDLNGDSRVDYLRVIEATEGNTHLIILQSVLGVDTFQDVATIEVERDRNNNVQVQVVGDTYLYGNNYIYEPIYVSRPFIYDAFWVSSYRPYYSPWYWGYYPNYYSYWAPYPVYTYRDHCHVHINPRNSYNYVNTRRSTRAIAMHNTRRANSYERQHPERSFTQRNEGVNNRYALDQSRGASRTSDRAATASSRSTVNGTQELRSNNVRSTNINAARSNGTSAVRSTTGTAPSRSAATTATRNSSQTVTPARTSTTVSTNPTTSATRSTTAQPARQAGIVTRSSAPAPAVRTAPARSTSAPAVRTAPAPAMRSAPAAAPRQSAPARTSSSGNTRSSRG